MYVQFSVAVVVAFFCCWAPFNAQRLITSYVSKWTPLLMEIQSTLFYISGESNNALQIISSYCLASCVHKTRLSPPRFIERSVPRPEKVSSETKIDCRPLYRIKYIFIKPVNRLHLFQ